MIDLIIGVLLLMSALMVLIASIGMWRFQNLYARMHVVTKVSSLGILLLLIAVNLFFLDWVVFIKTAVIFGVLVFLSPVSAHVIAKVSRSQKETDDFNLSNPSNKPEDNNVKPQ